MQILRLCFQCPGKFSELLPGDLEMSELFIEDLISQALRGLPSLMIVDTVRLFFSPLQNMYTFEVRIWCYERSKEPFDEEEDIEPQVESLISRALLQLFWVVSVDNADCWQQI